MSALENIFNQFKKFAWVAALIALVGFGDSAYLTIHHYTAEPVPCSIVAGCEMVLTSAYATLAGIPLGILGMIAYFFAFCLAVLTIFGKSKAWLLLGFQVILMAVFTGYLLYLQGYVIGAFCQFCLLSALSTSILLIVLLSSRFWRA